MEEHYTTDRLDGSDWGEPWASVDWAAEPGWEYVSAASDTPAELYALYDGAVARARASLAAALRDGGLDGPAHVGDGEGNHTNVRRLVLDMVVVRVRS